MKSRHQAIPDSILCPQAKDKRVRIESISFPKNDRWLLKLLTPLNIPSVLRLNRQSSSPQEKNPKLVVGSIDDLSGLKSKEGDMGISLLGANLLDWFLIFEL